MRNSLLVVILALFISLVACSNQADNKGVDLKVTLQPETITDELYVKMNYEYTFADKFTGFDKDYIVFVHFWRSKTKEILMGDDHAPVPKVTEWKKGDTVKYSRVIFIPKFLDEFDIDFEGYEEMELTIGLYIPQVKNSKIILLKKNFNIQAASVNAPEIVYDAGWWQLESDPQIKVPEERTWRWTTKKAVCIVENPKKESLMIINGRVDKTQFKDQKVIFKINDQVLEEFLPEEDAFTKRYVVTPAMMGTEDEFNLVIETDKAFVPSVVIPDSKDTRELGIRVYRIYFRENIQ